MGSLTQKQQTKFANFLKALTTKPGVYQMYDETGQLLYVGKAKNLKRRVGSYFSGKKDAKTSQLVSLIDHIDITITETEVEAFLLENVLITNNHPRYNVIFRDDKSYPYILLTAHSDFPRLAFHRGKTKTNQGRLFGPYPSSKAVRESIDLLERLFLLRQCDETYFQNRSRPCLQYQIKRCSAPCVGKISKEEYLADVAKAVQFLEGKSKDLMRDLIAQMEAAAAQEEFELAAKLRDQVGALRAIQKEQSIVDANEVQNIDVLAVAKMRDSACIHILTIREGWMLGSKHYFPDKTQGLDLAEDEFLQTFILQHYLRDEAKAKLPNKVLLSVALPDENEVALALREFAGRKVVLQSSYRGVAQKWVQMAKESAEHALLSRIPKGKQLAERFGSLQKVLALSEKLERIECFDVSHTGGEDAIAACVVFDRQGAVKADYRRFNLHVKPGDDYAGLREALQRHFSHGKEKAQLFPQLLIIDGGRGQLKIAENVLKELDIQLPKVIGVAKGPSRKPGQEQIFISSTGEKIDLPPEAYALHLIQEVRDEAHRFAITGHRSKRDKKRVQSSLENIPGIGEQRRRELLRQFGGLQEVIQASVNELASVPGISRVLAQRIYDALHGS